MNSRLPFLSIEDKFLRLCQLNRISCWQWAIAHDRVQIVGYLTELYATHAGELLTREAWLARYHPDDRPQLASALEQAVTAGKPVYLKLRFELATGKHLWARVVGRTHYHDGKPVLVYGTFQDVTAYCETLDTLRRAETRFRLVADHMQESVSLCDIDGRCLDLIILPKNLPEIRAEDLVGRSIYEFIHPDDRERVRTQSHDLVRRGQPALVSCRVRTADGSYLWVESQATPILDDAGQPKQIVCVTRDISARKQVEAEAERLRHRLWQAEKYQALADFAGSLAHDLNNALTSILGFSEIAQAERSTDATLASHLAQIKNATLRAANLIEQMLTFAGRRAVALTELALDLIIKEALPTFTDLFTEQIRLELDIEPGDLRIRGNRDQLIAAVQGLLANAVEALPGKSGTVTIRLARVAVTDPKQVPGFVVIEPRPNQYVCLSVRDTGRGISESDLPRLFEPFFSTKFTGRGLGLAVILGTVRHHGGFITVESVVDQGSTFSLYLPAHSEIAAQPVVDAPEARKAPARPTVLIIEDDPVVRELAALMLQQAGWQTLTAEDGLAGLDIVQAQTHNISVVLMDMIMPRLDGAATLARLEQIAPQLPVVIMSGYHQEQLGDLQRRKNFARYVQKPFTAATLNQAMLAALATTTAH